MYKIWNMGYKDIGPALVHLRTNLTMNRLSIPGIAFMYMNVKNIDDEYYQNNKKLFKYFMLGVFLKERLYMTFWPISIPCMIFDYAFRSNDKFDRHFKPLSVYFKEK